MTPHISSKKEEIAKIVLMPGDPLRAEYIAKNYLEEIRIVNKVRNMYAFTGKYNGRPITVMASGMGNPSMGIYSYELYKFYDVESIIRIGTAGSYKKDIGVKKIILADVSYSKSAYAKCQNGYEQETIEANNELNNIIEKTAKEQNIELYRGILHSSDVFYSEIETGEPEKNDCLAVEMESFALFANAKTLNKKAACLITISDMVPGHENGDQKLTPEEREKSLNVMIKLALDSTLKI